MSEKPKILGYYYECDQCETEHLDWNCPKCKEVNIQVDPFGAASCYNCALEVETVSELQMKVITSWHRVGYWWTCPRCSAINTDRNLGESFCNDCSVEVELVIELKNIKILSEEDMEYKSDKERILRIMKEHGYNCSIEQATILWVKYSDSMAAGWMHLDEDDESVYGNISQYFKEE